MNNITKKRALIIRNSKVNDFGGGERFAVLLAQALRDTNYEPTILSQNPRLLAFARDHGVKTARGKWWAGQNSKLARFLPIYLVWQIILTIWYWGLFVRKRPNIIHVQSKDDFVAATIAGRLLGKRIIWTDHSDLRHVWKNVDIWYKNPIGKIVYFAAKMTSRITFISESERALVSENLAAGGPVWQKLQVIYKGIIDVAANYQKNNNDKSFRFCVANRLVAEKGIREVIGAFNKLSKDYPDTKLVLLGDGAESTRLKQDAVGNKDILFMGYQEDPLATISQADVFVQPSYREGLSLALIEAGMLSLPIIATAVGGNPEVVHDQKTGLLVPPRDALALYDAMKLLYDDKSLRQRLATSAREQYVAKFQFDKIVVNDFLPLYEGVKK